jgi:hypothetical protein
MTLAEYTDEIMFSLGGIGDNSVEIEIGESGIVRCINRAFREVKQYVTTPAYMTLPFGARENGIGCTINLKDKNVYSVINVMRPDSYNSLSMNTLDVFGLNLTYSAITNMDAYANRMLRLQQLNTISTDLDFIWDAHTKELSVTMNPPFTNAITIQYIPDYKDVEEITEVFWMDIILRLATAYAKQAIGRIRSKYTLNSSAYSLDGETLLQEANTEIQEIRTFLTTNDDLVFPID